MRPFAQANARLIRTVRNVNSAAFWVATCYPLNAFSYVHMYMYIQSAKKEGEEWVHIKIIELKDKLLQLKCCQLVFVTSSYCTFIQLVGQYTVDEVVLQPVLDEMRGWARRCSEQGSSNCEQPLATVWECRGVLH